ncbi:hypothetical protein ACFSL6_07885 [Paenibacillus thailandensis]|uniref:Uncharacterized protein n=1 Tax=Paenibacillus thailandensis TaxID=393250 RepID=A0ABW5QWF8_9BACL
MFDQINNDMLPAERLWNRSPDSFALRLNGWQINREVPAELLERLHLVSFPYERLFAVVLA